MANSLAIQDQRDVRLFRSTPATSRRPDLPSPDGMDLLATPELLGIDPVGDNVDACGSVPRVPVT